MKRIFAVFVCAISIGAQAGSPKKMKPPTAPETAVANPVTDFKALVASASSPTEWTNLYQNPKTQKWVKQYFSSGEIAYDVIKTDSLLNPVKGVVSFPVTIRLSDAFDSKEAAENSTSSTNRKLTYFMTGEYFLTEGNWQMKQFSYQVAIGDGPTDRMVEVLPRQKIVDNISNGTGMAVILQKWLR